MNNAVKKLNNPPKKCKPFLKWAGGKTKLLPSLINLLPKTYNNYFEPFIGGGALFFYLKPKKAYISDLNSELIDCYLSVKENSEKLISYLKEHKHDKDYFYDLRELGKKTDFVSWDREKKSARLMYLNKTCFNGLYRVNKKGEFNVPFGRHKNPLLCDEYNINLCSKILKNTEIKLADFSNILEQVEKKDFVYFDPPYVPTGKYSNFTSYTLENFNEDSQKRLADFCKQITEKKVKFMLSNSNAELVFKLYKDFNIHKVNAPRSINSKTNKRSDVVELIITNY